MITRSKEKIKEIVEFVSLLLYNSLLSNGAKSVRKKMKEMEVEPLPSVSTIYRIQRDKYLTHDRAGYPDDM